MPHNYRNPDHGGRRRAVRRVTYEDIPISIPFRIQRIRRQPFRRRCGEVRGSIFFLFSSPSFHLFSFQNALAGDLKQNDFGFLHTDFNTAVGFFSKTDVSVVFRKRFDIRVSRWDSKQNIVFSETKFFSGTYVRRIRRFWFCRFLRFCRFHFLIFEKVVGNNEITQKGIQKSKRLLTQIYRYSNIRMRIMRCCLVTWICISLR